LFAPATHRLTVNGVNYSFGWQHINGFNFDGLAGNDDQPCRNESRRVGGLRPTVSAIWSNWYQAVATGQSVTLESNGGGDTAYFSDSAGNDTFFADPARATMSGAGFANTARGFSRVEASASSGNDAATFHDSPGNDTYIASASYAALVGNGFYNLALGFDETTAESIAGGVDSATLFDSAGNDTFVRN
jgi:hypothetical protein